MRISRKKRTVGILFIFCTVFLAFSGNFPTSRTGAPGDSGDCGNCHNNNGNFSGFVNLVGPPSSMMGGEFTDVLVEVGFNSGSPFRGGFSIVAIDDTNENDAGMWDDQGDGLFTFDNNTNRNYWGHSPAMNFGGSSMVSWEAGWYAPNITDDVTMYYCAVIGNGSNGNSGDEVVCDQFTISVTGTLALEAMIINQSDVTCPGGNNGAAEVEAINGAPPYTYEWDNGEDEALANMLDSDTHTVTVTDENGATATASVFIDEPNDIGVDADVSDVLCNDDSNGSIELIPFGGSNNNFFCEWEQLGFGCTQDGLEAGEYFVTVTDGAGCTEEFIFEIEEPDELEVNLTTTDASSPGASDGTATANVTGGTPGYDYDWSNGANTQTITGLSPGSYSVTVTDDNNCETTESVMVSGGACTLTVSPMLSAVACYGESTGMIGLAVMGGSAPLTYQWSNNTSDPNLVNVPAGVYGVTVTDTGGCSQAFTGLNVTQPDSLDVTLVDLQSVACPGEATGSIAVAVSGGAQDYVLTWSTGATNDTTIIGMDTLVNIPDTLTNLGAGLYTYNLVDGNGCVRNGFYQVEAQDSIAPTILLAQGMVELDGNGFAPAATFDLVDAGSTDNCGITNVSFAAGPFSCADIGVNEYPVFITDASNNIASGTALIQVVETIAPTINCGNSAVATNSCGPVSYVIPTAADNCGNPSVSLVSGPQSGSVFSTGTSVVTYQAMDECGNSASCSFEVVVDFDLAANFLVQDATCASANGSISVLVEGGTPPYDIQPFGEFQTGLASGLYTITVTDNTGCQTIENVTISQEDGPEVILSVTDDDCSSASIGSVAVDISGGVPPYTASINGGASFSVSDTLIGGLSSGDYIISIQDANGCEDLTAFQIIQPAAPTVSLPNFQIDCNGGSVLVDFSPQYPNLSFQGYPATIAAGTYNVIVTDPSTACTTEAVFSVTEPSPLEFFSITTNVQSACDFTINDIILDVRGGTTPYSNEIIDSGASAQGPYIARVTDGNNCVLEQEFTLDMLELPTDLVYSIEQDVDCDGIITVTESISGGCPPYTSSMDVSQITEAGAYSVEIRDDMGTVDTFDFTITDIPNLEIASADIVNSTTGEPGVVTVEVAGGLAPLSYVWTDSLGVVISNEPSVLFNGPGDVFLSVTDARGCQVNSSYFVDFFSTVVDLDEENSLVKVFPNPTFNVVKLSFSDEPAQSVSIYDLHGQLYEQRGNLDTEQEIDLDAYAPGLYLMKFSYKDKVIVKEILKL